MMQHRSRFWQGFRKAYAKYDQMMEKQGFYVVLVVCIAVIAASALYTFRFRENESFVAVPQTAEESVTAHTQNDQSVIEAQQLVQSQSAQALPLPTETPFRFVQPLSGVTIREFSVTEPQLFEAARYWRIHPGIDLAAEYGSPVSAAASGNVSDVWQDNENGLCVRIMHEYGYETIYAGLSSAAYIRAGDYVAQGQTIGHVGNGVTAECDAQPHLHFEMWRNGSPVDPVKGFLGIDQ